MIRLRRVALLTLPILVVPTNSAEALATAPFRYEHGQPLNNLAVTPGTVFNVGVATICTPGYSASVRDVPESEKTRVYLEYGITHHVSGQYEVDHLISLELGGNNAISNLWPELNDRPSDGYLNSKDILENRLHALVCAHRLSLKTAQQRIATDWVTEYHAVFDTWPKAFTSGSGTAPTSNGGSVPSSGSAAAGTATITALSSPVPAGSTASLSVHSTETNGMCDLTVTLPSGRTSTAAGLGPAATNSAGDATWTWSVSSNTDPGTARASVSCGSGSASRTFTIAGPA